jgi:hypothetical protein
MVPRQEVSADARVQRTPDRSTCVVLGSRDILHQVCPGVGSRPRSWAKLARAAQVLPPRTPSRAAILFIVNTFDAVDERGRETTEIAQLAALPAVPVLVVLRLQESVFEETGGTNVSTTKRSLYEGIGYGIVAGAIFAVIEVIGSAAMGMPALAPLRMFASILWGQEAMTATAIGSVVLVGALVHVVLSAIFGAIYGLIDSRFSDLTQRNYGRQAAYGLLFGAALWFVNFQIIARLAFPWFLDAPQFMQLMLHAVCFGLPLGLMYAASERHTARQSRIERPAAEAR